MANQLTNSTKFLAINPSIYSKLVWRISFSFFLVAYSNKIRYIIGLRMRTVKRISIKDHIKIALWCLFGTSNLVKV